MRRDRLLDFGIPVAVFVLTLALIAAPEATDSGRDGRNLDALAFLLAAATAAPLVLRRSAPLLAFTLSTLASTLLFAADYPPGPPIGPTVALYFVASASAPTASRRAFALAVTAALLLFHVTVFGVAHDTVPDGELLMGTLLWAAVWSPARERERVERGSRSSRSAPSGLSARPSVSGDSPRPRSGRGSHATSTTPPATRSTSSSSRPARRGCSPRRIRSARARRSGRSRRWPARRSREIDALVRALREDEPTRVEPPAGLAALDALVERHRDAGLDVDVVRARRARGPSPRGVDQAAYRILQEALTNARAARARRGGGRARRTASTALEIAVDQPDSPGTAPAPAAATGSSACASARALLGGQRSTPRRRRRPSPCARGCPTARTHE